ncbi:MAG TPA: hypothetical protein VIM98_04705 [Dyella sp.]|uniref:hypothetical protein n=1 Tax=Dyella sp. TaxID=1869338 RepID=UPI002F93C517
MTSTPICWLTGLALAILMACTRAPTLAGFLPRIARYYPHWLGVTSGYVAAAVALQAAAVVWGGRSNRLQQGIHV